MLNFIFISWIVIGYFIRNDWNDFNKYSLEQIFGIFLIV